MVAAKRIRVASVVWANLCGMVAALNLNTCRFRGDVNPGTLCFVCVLVGFYATLLNIMKDYHCRGVDICVPFTDRSVNSDNEYLGLFCDFEHPKPD